MATQWQSFPVQFGGGLISNLSPLQHGLSNIGSAATLENFEPSLDGGYKKVLGYTKFISSALSGSGNVQGVAIVPESGATKVIAIRNGVYYLANSSAGSPSWSTLATASSTNMVKIRQTSYNFTGTTKMVFVDSLNYPAYYDVSGGSLSFLSGGGTGNSAVQAATYVSLYKNTLFFSKNNELIFTAPYTDTDFNVANGAGTISVSSEIVGTAVYRESLIIFCSDKIVRLTGSSSANFELSPITEDLGCTDADSIREVGGDVMFLAPDGIRTISSTERIGDFGIDVASKPIRPTLNKQLESSVHITSLVLREKAQYRLFHFDTTKRVDVSRGLLATKFIDQGGQGFQWAELKGYKVFVCDSNVVDGVEYAYFANEDGYVYRLESGNDRDGSNISSIYESADMPINDPQVRKTFYKLDLYIKPEGVMNLDVSVKLDAAKGNTIQPATFSVAAAGGEGAVFGAPTSVYNASGGTTYSDIVFSDATFQNNIVGSGTTMALRIADDSTDPSFNLDTAVLEYSTDDRQ